MLKILELDGITILQNHEEEFDYRISKNYRALSFLDDNFKTVQDLLNIGITELSEPELLAIDEIERDDDYSDDIFKDVIKSQGLSETMLKINLLEPDLKLEWC